MSIAAETYRRLVAGSLKGAEKVPDVDEWMRFLEDLPDPSDEIDRSFNKYQCRKWYISKGKLVLLNLAALVYLMMALPRLLKRGKAVSKPKNDLLVIIRHKSVRTDDILPNALVSRFSAVEEIERPSFNNGSLCREARELFFNCARRHPLSFYYLLFVLKELSIHSAILGHYDASAVAVYVAERNVATPLLRKLYEESGREFDSFMHGEYLLQLVQAYSSFTNYYVWDDSYVSMFEDLKFHCDSLEVYTPKKLQKKWNLEAIQPDHYCTYYFSGESERSIENIASLFQVLERRGYVCKVRPHPRYSHTQLIHQLFDSSRIEDPTKVSIRDSLSSTQIVVGLTTTVLFEAKTEGKLFVIDDLSDSDRYCDLKARRFRLLADNPVLLSEISEVRNLDDIATWSSGHESRNR